MAVEDAAERALAQGQFTSGGLAASGGRVNAPAMQRMGRAAEATMPAEQVSPWRTAIGWGLLGGGAIAEPTDIGAPALGGIATAAGLLGTRRGQRALAGDYAGQRFLADYLRRRSAAPLTATLATSGE